VAWRLLPACRGEDAVIAGLTLRLQRNNGLPCRRDKTPKMSCVASQSVTSTSTECAAHDHVERRVGRAS